MGRAAAAPRSAFLFLSLCLREFYAAKHTNIACSFSVSFRFVSFRSDRLNLLGEPLTWQLFSAFSDLLFLLFRSFCPQYLN